jgi:glycine/D-amino acid oxidase-like deaminating enzyme
MRVSQAVIGAGVMGVTLTRALARRGHDVVLLSGCEPGSEGASAAPAALLNPFRGRTGRASSDDVAALQQMWALVAELAAEGRDVGAVQSGVLRLIDSTQQARSFAKVAGLALWDAETFKQALPAPQRLRAPHGVGFASSGGWLEPRRFLRATLDSARAAGAEQQLGGRIEAIEPTPHGWRCTSADGHSTEAAEVWLCLGADAWPAQFSRTLAAPPPIERLAGDIFPTTLQAPPWPLAGGSYVAPLGGLAAIGGHHREPGPPPADAWPRLVAALRWAWPELHEGVLREGAGWWGVRAHAAQNRPLVQAVAQGVTVVGALAGRGFLIAAALANRLAAGASR